MFRIKLYFRRFNRKTAIVTVAMLLSFSAGMTVSRFSFSMNSNSVHQAQTVNQFGHVETLTLIQSCSRETFEARN